MSGLHVTGLRLTNFRCFRGTHELALGPGVHAVVAHSEDDLRRSNWNGKSTFLWAFRFALTGEHPNDTEDEWITDGEREGGIDLELSNGTFVSRARVRGAATKLVIEHNGCVLHGTDAQAALDVMRCMDKADDLATWWVEQKQIDRFVQQDPAPRAAVVAKWVGIEPVQEAAELVGQDLRMLLASQAEVDRDLQAAAADCAKTLSDFGASDLADLEVKLAAHRERVAVLEAEETEHAKLALALATRAREDRDAAEYQRQGHAIDQLTERLRSLPLVTTKAIDAADVAYEAAASAHGEAAAVLKQKKQLARGAFDGVCPVGGIACPVTAQLNADRSTNEQLHAAALGAELSLGARMRTAQQQAHALKQAKHEREQLKLQAVERQAAQQRLRPAWEAVQARQQAPVADRLPVDGLAAAKRDLAATALAVEVYVRSAAKVDAGKVSLRKCAPAVQAHREALAILGRTGVQRRLAEGMLSEVEAGANDLLARCGVDLRVAYQWAREGKKLADNCQQCGAPFPSSTKVRECATCGEPRGPKLEEKLRVVLSRKSGGADDMVGLATYLAGGAWLRARRQSPWSVACIDEPFGALDAHNRKALARHLVAMLATEYGYDQAFVTAHDQATLDAMPKRVVITATVNGSRIEVQQ